MELDGEDDDKMDVDDEKAKKHRELLVGELKDFTKIQPLPVRNKS